MPTQKEIMMLGNRLGIDTDKFQEEDTGSQGAYDYDALYDEVERVGANHYDFRRSTEAATLAGEKVPNKFGSAEDVYKVDEWMKSQHRGGGKYSSAQDRANVTNYWVQKDRDQITDRLDALEEQKDDQQTDEAVEPQDEYDIVLSDRAQEAQDFTEGHTWAPSGNSAKDESLTLSPFATTKYAGLNDEIDTDLKDAYTLNLTQGLKGAGIPTRGPGAPGTPGGYGS